MNGLFVTPVWFHGWDILFDLVGLVIALFIAGYSWRVFRLSKETKYLYFSLAFVMVSFALLVKGITSSTVYFSMARTAADAVLGSAVGTARQYSVIFYRLGYFLEMAPMLGAWLLVFFISQKGRRRLQKFHEMTQIGLFIYLVLLVSVVSNFQYTVFYLTSTVLLSLIVLNYYKNYLRTQNPNSLKVMNAFIFIFLGNLAFIFIFLSETLYVVGEVFMLIGFIQLLLTYIKITSR